MADSLNAEVPVPGARPLAYPTAPTAPPRQLLWSLFPVRGDMAHSVTTRARFHAHPDAVWNRILFFEELPGRPPLFLRLFLPRPFRTKGDKRREGAIVHCLYDGGYLVKRITAVDPPRLLRFEIVEQHLGMERCVQALRGSYEVALREDGVEVALTTQYCTRLWPRFVWRVLEEFIATRMHRYILSGIRAALAAECT